ISEMPSHNHTVSLSVTEGTSSTADQGGTAGPAMTSGAQGGGDPHNNMQPYLTLNYIIKL
ncbi:MAG: phage tail protein, partial [Gammaproteobacteria bacterium]|nr:phage tail protein [Gammaproteobacteria bacterium]